LLATQDSPICASGFRDLNLLEFQSSASWATAQCSNSCRAQALHSGTKGLCERYKGHPKCTPWPSHKSIFRARSTLIRSHDSQADDRSKRQGFANSSGGWVSDLLTRVPDINGPSIPFGVAGEMLDTQHPTVAF